MNKHLDPVIDQVLGDTIETNTYYAPILARSKIIQNGVSTAGVRWMRDRLELYISLKFMTDINDRTKRRGLILHEILHYVLRHLAGSRRLKIEALWCSLMPDLAGKMAQGVNIAEDMEINEGVIPRDQLPDCGCFPSDYKFQTGLLAEEYVRLMAEEKKKHEAKGGSKKGKSQWPKIEEDLNSDDWMDILKGQQDFDEIDEMQLEELLKECEAKSRGDTPAGLERVLKALRPPQLKWPRKFYSTMTSMLRTPQTLPTWARANRRNLPIAGKYFKSKPPCKVLQDTSGSVTTAELGILSSEIYGLRRYFSNVEVFVIDAAIQARYRFRGTIESVKGGGGSDFIPAFDAIEDEGYKSPPVIILLTDGDISVPKECPNGWRVYWVLCQGDRDIPYGEKLILDRPGEE